MLFRSDVSRLIGEFFGRRIIVVPSRPAAGGTRRRCPDITKMASLGYQPKFTFRDGLPRTAQWYADNAGRAPQQRSLSE